MIRPTRRKNMSQEKQKQEIFTSSFFLYAILCFPRRKMPSEPIYISTAVVDCSRLFTGDCFFFGGAGISENWDSCAPDQVQRVSRRFASIKEVNTEIKVFFENSSLYNLQKFRHRVRLYTQGRWTKLRCGTFSSAHQFSSFEEVYYKVWLTSLQSATALFITKCDGGVLQSATAILFQSVIEVITKCDRYYKVWLRLLQGATGVTKCDDYYKVRQYSSR